MTDNATTPIAQERRYVGRPSSYSVAIANEICERIAEGESLRTICRDAHIPSRMSVIRWLADPVYESFRDQYARAREAQADYIADEVVEIADTATDANLARVRIDARKWQAGKMHPKRYGDKIVLGGDAENPINVVNTIELRVVKPKGQISGP